MGWMVANLVGGPHQQAIREEVQAIGGIGELSVENMAKLEYTSAFVKEVLRLHPPAIWSVRTVVSDFELHGHRIPAGEMVLFSPHVTQLLEDQFPEPHVLKPGRWIEGHNDQHAAHAYAYIPFGGGPRRCLGFAFATQELIVMTATVASRVHGRMLEGHRLEPTGTMSSAPLGGVPVVIEKLE